MDALFKKFVNTGVGYLAQGNKLVQAAIEKLVQENKISEQEGQKIVADLLQSGETKRADLEKQFKRITTDLRTRVGLGDEQVPTSAKAKPAAAKKPASSPVAKAAGAKASEATAKTHRPATAKAGAVKKAAAPASRPKTDQ